MSSATKVEDAVEWFRSNATRLNSKPAQLIADEFGDVLLAIDEQLGLEVSKEFSSEGEREIILTTFSEPRLFSLVRRLVELLNETPGWCFVPLKPPRGFDFKLMLAESYINAADLSYAGIPDIEGGVQLLLSPGTLNELPADSQEMAWLVVETGIGEELTAKLAHVEFASRANSKDYEPIANLRNYVEKLN